MNKQIEEIAKIIANKTNLSIIEATGIAEILTVEGCRKANDVVEVVRCKDCKYWGKHGGCVPHQHLHKCFRQYGAAMSENDFCSLGEKGEALYD